MRKSSRKQEENTKIKLVLPLLRNGLNYDNDDEFDFEHDVKSGRVDIAIIVNNKPAILIEVKDENENLDRHIERAIEYGWEKQIEFVALTNGREFRIYATFAKGIPAPSDRLIKSFEIFDPKNPPSELYKLFSRASCPDFFELKKEKSKLRPKATEDDLTRILKKSTEDLFNILFPQFKKSYQFDRKFKNKIDLWATNVKLDIKDELIEKLCKEGAYSLINRVLFYRICEDRSPNPPKISESSLKQWRDMVEKPSVKLNELFKKSAKKGFSQFYDSPLFNSIKFDDVKWDQSVIFRVLSRFANIDFKQIDNDLIGKAYESHIPEKERKNLGQFYTPQFIVEYLIEQLDLTSKSQILDPACGSGAFLTHVLDKLTKKTNITPSLAIENNLYGIDINPFANQLTTMNLLLKTLDCDKKPEQINILSADSLVDKKISEEGLFLSVELGAEAKKNAQELNQFFDSGHKKFDAVIGNPPYRCFGLQSKSPLTNIYKDYLKNRWKSSFQYKSNYYPLFVERSIELLNEKGILAFILPDNFLVGYYFYKIRKHILDTCKILEIVLCKKNFWNADSGHPTLLILQKESNKTKRDNNQITVKLARTADHIKTRQFIKNRYSQSIFQNTSLNRFELYFNANSKALVETMRFGSTGIIRDVVLGYSGAIAAPGFKKNDIISKSKTNSFFKKGLYKGSEIMPYQIKYNGGFIRVDSKTLRSGYDPNIMNSPKILVRRTGDSFIAAIDRKRFYHTNCIHSFYIKDKSSHICLEWICILLNSKILNAFYHIVSMKDGRVYPQVDIDQVEDLPFVEPSREIIIKAKKLYQILSSHQSNEVVYINAIEQAENLVANAYEIGKSLKNFANKEVTQKRPASKSAIQKVREKSHRKRKEVSKKRKKIK